MGPGLALLAAAAAIAPTLEDVDVARVMSVPGNFSHCVEIKDLKCKPTQSWAKRFDCSYRENVAEGQWEPRKITVENIGGNWTKMAGDAAQCTVVYLEIGNQAEAGNNGSNQ